MHTDNHWFKDETGRTLLLRGVNLGGSSKVPFSPHGATWRSEGFYDYEHVSFVGRPFPLIEADEHFTRLKAWGFTFLRFLITWEAVEHQAPGVYDTLYLDYLEKVLSKALEYGITVFIDPHQDVWSRWTGGDGAPAWTMEKVGMDITKLEDTGAAFTHNIQGDPFPRMVWPANCYKLGSATMFTLFFGGNAFAPQTKVDGIPVQEYLQGHYIAAMKQVAMRLKHLPNVIGFDTMNEPSNGYIGYKNLASNRETVFKIGLMPAPYQSMLAGSGYAPEVNDYRFNFARFWVTGREVINPEGVNLWKQGYECIWKTHGVWTDKGGKPELLKPDYFTADFTGDFLQPFLRRFTAEIRSVKKDTMIFIEGVPVKDHPAWTREDGDRVVNSGHWYDVYTLFRKRFTPWLTYNQVQRKLVIGKAACARSFARELAFVKEVSAKQMGGIPTLIGECGLPVDMDGKRAYKTGDFRKHVQAFAAYLNGMDANLLSFTLWNYTADNTNARGDQWNDEDLSLFSRDQQTDSGFEDGGRGVQGFVRPYAMKTAGTPVTMSFDLKKRLFRYSFRPDADIAFPTEIFVPHVQYARGYAVLLTDGRYEKDEAGQVLRIYYTGSSNVLAIEIKPVG